MIKYPRTFHLPISPGISSDDKVIPEKYLSNFIGRALILTEKVDGGNSCLKGQQGVYARSHTTQAKEPWFDLLKNCYYSIHHKLNPDLWIFGENTYAIHSITYTELTSTFYIFNIFNSKTKTWLSWEDVKLEAERLGFPTVPVVMELIVSTFKSIEVLLEHNIKLGSELGGEIEGLVLRVADSFADKEFDKSVAKYVRKDHVQTDEHWTRNWKPQNIKL